MVQNEKKLSLLHSISQELYIKFFLFMVHICKMIIFSGFSSFFQTFCVVRGGGVQSFLEICLMQNKFLVPHKLQDHVYE